MSERPDRTAKTSKSRKPGPIQPHPAYRPNAWMSAAMAALFSRSRMPSDRCPGVSHPQMLLLHVHKCCRADDTLCCRAKEMPTVAAVLRTLMSTTRCRTSYACLHTPMSCKSKLPMFMAAHQLFRRGYTQPINGPALPYAAKPLLCLQQDICSTSKNSLSREPAQHPCCQHALIETRHMTLPTCRPRHTLCVSEQHHAAPFMPCSWWKPA